MNRKRNIFHFFGTLNLVVGLLITLVSICVVTSTSIKTEGTFSLTGLIPGGIVLIWTVIGTLVFYFFGNIGADLENISYETTEQQKRLDYQSNQMIKTNKTLEEILNVIKSIDKNQSIIGNYSSEQLNNINTALSSK